MIGITRLLRDKFKCDICSSSFDRKASLGCHKFMAHGIKSKAKKELKLTENGNSSPAYKRKLRSSPLGRQNKSSSHLDRSRKKGKESHLIDVSTKVKSHEDKKLYKDKKELPFKCDLCPAPKYFAGLKCLENHIIDVHVVDKEFPCHACSKSFLTEEDLKRHSWSHHSSRRACLACSRNFRNLDCLRRHLLASHGEAYYCDSCSESFPGTADFKSHRKKAKKAVDCAGEFCPLKFDSRCLARSHFRIHHGVMTSKSKKKSGLQAEEASGFIPTATTRICKLPRPSGTPATIKGSTSPALSVEIKTPTQQKPVPFLSRKSKSNYFPNKFEQSHQAVPTRRKELQRRPNFAHPEDITWSCESCPETFNSLEDLCEHRDSVHDGIKNNNNNCGSETSYSKQCETCFSAFANELDLKLHLSKHCEKRDDELHFKCKQCQKSFRLKNDYSQHLVLVHQHGKEENDKSYKCPHCPARFIQKTHLEQSHLPTHSEDRPFICEYCFKTFKTRNIWLTHVKAELNKLELRKVS